MSLSSCLLTVQMLQLDCAGRKGREHGQEQASTIGANRATGGESAREHQSTLLKDDPRALVASKNGGE